MDKQSNRIKFHKNNPTNNWISNLISYNFIDTYREINPTLKEFTWSNSSQSKSRIDQIWMSPKPTWNLVDAYIDSDTKPLINSDHIASVCEIETWHLEHINNTSFHHQNKRFNWSNTSEKQWTKYTEFIEQYIISIPSYLYSISANDKWNTLRDIILKSTNKFIKKLHTHRNNRIQTSDNHIPKRIILLQRILQHINRITNNNTTTLFPLSEIQILSSQASNLFQNFPTPPNLNDPTTISSTEFSSWTSSIKDLLITHKIGLRIITNFKKHKAIANFTLRRQQFLESNKKAMINSILNKPKNNITLNKLIIHSPHTQIITDPEHIKQHVKEHFQNWTAKRNIKNLSDFPNWTSEYEPIPQIQTSWYDPIIKPFTMDEISKVINSRHNNSAPGPSQIPYIAIKKLGPKTIEYITTIFNNILHTGAIPTEWCKGSIYPIPKTTAWENNINITRPITLLETIRKIFTKCLTNRLNSILTSHPILLELNWAALPGSSTQDPIHILQNIIEDAKEKSQQAWILSQDMSKAYDSVNSDMLELALHRIRIPPIIVTIIINLFQNRLNSVITPFGNSPEYLVEDGIDQGDTISPLLW